MNSFAARKLRPGDRVRWTYPGDEQDEDGNPRVGEVTTFGADCVRVRWDGDNCDYPYLYRGSGTAGITFIEYAIEGTP